MPADRAARAVHFSAPGAGDRYRIRQVDSLEMAAEGRLVSLLGLLRNRRPAQR
jgi:hypothetical protein